MQRLSPEEQSKLALPCQTFLRTALGDIPVFDAGTNEPITQSISQMAFEPFFDNPRMASVRSIERYQDDPFADPADPFADILEDVIQSHIRHAGANRDDGKSDCGPCCYYSDVESDAESDNGSDSDASAIVSHGRTQLAHNTTPMEERTTKKTQRFHLSVKSLFFIKPCRNHNKGHICTPRHRMRRMMRRWKRRAARTANKTAAKARHSFSKLVSQTVKVTVMAKNAALVASTTTVDTLKNALTSTRNNHENKVLAESRAEARARVVRRKRANAVVRNFDLTEDATAQDAFELTDRDVVAMVMESGHGRRNGGNDTEVAPLLQI